MSNVLERINADKRSHVDSMMARRPLAELRDAAASQPAPRGFTSRLQAAAAGGGYGLIAEIKRASPSKGLIREDFDPPSLARAYRDGGATCLSVLTDIPYFQGDDGYLVAARDTVDLPALRKDFMIDPYQITESRALGADCILLILAALEDSLAVEMEAEALALGMDVLIEVHDEAELDRALALKSSLVGINNRNLKTMKTDTATSRRLAARVPAGRIVVSESGLGGPGDLAAMAACGVRCFLIGESLMRQEDVAAATRALLENPAPVTARPDGAEVP